MDSRENKTECVPSDALFGTSAAALDPNANAELVKQFAKSRGNRIARNAVTSMDVMAAARNPVTMRTYSDTYRVAVKAPKTVTNQRQSGRCWMFSTLNTQRVEICRLLDVDDFEFSQAYGMFYDKLEKANAFLGNIIATAHLPFDDRAVTLLLENPAPDGGEWRFAANLIEKWGVVPKEVMPETACTKDSSQMNRYLNRLLRRDAAILRAAVEQGKSDEELQEHRRQMMEDVHRVLCICLGEPPLTFDFELAVGEHAEVDPSKVSVQEGAATTGKATGTEDAKLVRILREEGITPQEFQRRYVRFDANDYVDLVSCPGATRPFERVVGVRWMDTVVGAPVMRMLNMPSEVLERAAVASLKAGHACYMACDVSQQFARHIEDFPGVLALDAIDADGLFDIDLNMDKATMYDMRESCMTHAMTFQGVELADDGTPRAWRVENSWGKDACKDGYLIMSGEWFRLYGGEVVVRREFLDEQTLNLWDTLPIEMCNPWDAVASAVRVK